MERRWIMTCTTLVILAMGALSWGIRQRQATPSSLTITKTVDEYWVETELSSQHLLDVVNDVSCRSSQRYFLSCVNALSAVAERLGLQLTPLGLLLRETKDIADQTEKSLLQPWKQLYQDGKRVQQISFQKIWHEMYERYLKSVEKESYIATALNAFLSVFRDPHSYLLPASYYKDVVARVKTKSSSLGVIFARSEGHYYIRKVILGSSAAEAGLQKGDWVLSINGTRLDRVTSQRLTELLKQTNHRPVADLEIKRDERVFSVKIKRSAKEIPSVFWTPLESTRPVAVLTLNKVAGESCSEVKKALIEIKAQGYKGLLLDLRDNNGGQMDEAACIVSLFVEQRPLLVFKTQPLNLSLPTEEAFGDEEFLWNGKMAVLINSGTASAAEIIAGSLRDYNRALLVGERTFGKGSYQEGEVWNKNSRVAFFQTRGFYYLPSGVSPQGEGLTPDIESQFRNEVSHREFDLYENPLRAPRKYKSLAPPKTADLSSCLEVEALSQIDPQLQKAQTALFCPAVSTAQ